MGMAVALIVLGCLGAALLTRRLQATATLPVTLAVGGVVVLAGAVGSGSLGSLLLVLGLGALAWLLGETLLRRLPPTAGGVLVRLPMATGLGLGLLGLLLLGLATLGILSTATVVGGAATIALLGLLLSQAQLRQSLTSCAPGVPSRSPGWRRCWWG